MRNLVGDLQLAGVRDRMMAELGRWMRMQGDPGALLDTEEQWKAAREGGHLMPTPAKR